MIEHDERSEKLRARCLSRHDGTDGEMTGAGDANPKQFECDAPRLECMPPGVMRRLPDGTRTSQAVFGRVSWGDERQRRLSVRIAQTLFVFEQIGGAHRDR